MIPCDALAGVSASSAVHIHLAEHGGHLGFVGRRGVDADRRWMDWRVVDWVMARDRESSAPAASDAGVEVLPKTV